MHSAQRFESNTIEVHVNQTAQEARPRRDRYGAGHRVSSWNGKMRGNGPGACNGGSRFMAGARANGVMGTCRGRDAGCCATKWTECSTAPLKRRRNASCRLRRSDHRPRCQRHRAARCHAPPARRVFHLCRARCRVRSAAITQLSVSRHSRRFPEWALPRRRRTASTPTRPSSGI